MYCIYKIDDKNEEKVIKIIDSKEEFYNEIKKKSCEILSNMDIQQIKYDKSLKLGFYLLNNDDQTQLIEKCDVIVNGYIYNSTYIDVKILCTWKIIPMELNDNTPDESSDLKKSEPTNSNKNESNIVENYLGENLKFKEFNYDIQHDTKNLIINGIDRYSVIKKLIDDKLTLKYNFDILIVTMKGCDTYYKTYYSHLNITYGDDDTIIKNYLVMRELKIKDKIFNSKGIVVIDNCKSINNSEIMARLLFSARHYGITLIMSIDCKYNLRPEFRINFESVFLLHPYLMEEKKAMYDKYGSAFKSFDNFILHFVPTNSKYIGLVINHTPSNINKMDNIFYLPNPKQIKLNK